MIGVVGAGTMGRGIAQVFAQAGFPVRIYDSVPQVLERARGTIGDGLKRLVDKGKIPAAEAEATVGRIGTVSSLRGIGESELVVEAVIEQAAVKTETLKAIDSFLPDGSILATNTSSISITQLASATKNPRRFIGMHFFNPVPVMKLVEIVLGADTSEETFQRTSELAKAIGKTPSR